MQKLLFLIVIILTLNISNIKAESFSDTSKTSTILKGQIISENISIPNITLRIKGSNIATTSNSQGYFKISNVPTGQITLIAQGIGYQSKEITLTIYKNKTFEVNFDLKQDYINLDQVVVSADKTEVNRAESPVVVNVISTKIMSITGAVCGADILNFQPGLRVENNCQNCGFTQLRMNGMDGAYSQILINSRPIFSALNGVYGLEQIPSEMIERIEIVRGGGSALFGGNAIAGTVNIITKNPSRNSFQIGTNLQLIEGKIPDFNLNFNTSIVTDNSKSGIYLFGTKRDRTAFDANNDGFSEIAKLNNNSIGFSAFHKITNQSTITVDFHSINEFRRGGNDFNKLPHLTDITEQVEHEIIGGGINFDYKSKDYNTKFSFFASGQLTNRHSYYGAEMDPAAYGYTKDISQIIGVQFSHNFNFLSFAPIKFVAGAENVYSKLLDTKLGFYDEDSNTYQPDRLLVNQELFTPGAYAQTEWNFNVIKLLVGARYDVPDNRLNISPVFMPRANALIKLGRLTKIRLSYAKGYRAPQIFDEDLHIEASVARKHLHKNSDNLTAEISNSLSGSMDFTKSFDNVQTYFLAEYFYTKLENPFSNEYSFDEATKILTLLKTNATSGAWVQGANFEGKIAFSANLEFQIGGTIQKSQYVDAQPWSEDELFTTKDFTRTPNKYGYFVAFYKPLKSTNISLTGNYTGSMLVPHLAGGNDANGIEITNDELLVTNPFYDFSLNISQSFNLSDDTKIELSAGIKNIFNSYQNDFDSGKYRDAGFIYGPILPRTFIFSFKIGSR